MYGEVHIGHLIGVESVPTKYLSDSYPSIVPRGREASDRNLAGGIGSGSDRCYAILIIDVDQFRAVNETLGHAVGVEVIERVGERLESELWEDNKLLRLPGDKFAILFHSVLSPEAIGVKIRRLKDLLQRTYMVYGELVNITVSMGMAHASEINADSETLLRRAEVALQSAKSLGFGTVRLFESTMEDRRAMRDTLARDLPKALLLRQLEVHYQPQVDMKSEALTGFEALLRWQHPKLGWISPADFIPLAEEAGLIGRMGDWVLRTACKEVARLPPDIGVAVNASPLQFGDESFLASVERALSAAGIPASRLEVEITEGVLLKNENSVLSTLNAIRSMGVRLAMDDFGTGYSSLGQLAKLPFDTIKIDRSLVGGSEKQRAIVRAIATLGEGIGMSTLAEGIETEEQLVKAYSDGCISAQGYLFGKAVPASGLDQVLAQYSRPIYGELKRRA